MAFARQGVVLGGGVNRGFALARAGRRSTTGGEGQRDPVRAVLEGPIEVSTVLESPTA